MKKTLFILTLLSLGFAVSLPASAEGINLSDYETWDLAYTEGDDVWYYDSDTGTHEWTISNGEYSVTTPSSSYGIELRNTSTLSLSDNASLNIENTSDVAYGIYLSSSEFTNSGSIDIDVTSRARGYGIGLTSSSTFNNNGSIDINVTAETTCLGIFLNSSTFNNYSDGTININSSIYGVRLLSSSFYNEGSLFTDSIYIADSGSNVYLLDGSTLGAYTNGESVSISGEGTVYLGGALSGSEVVETGSSSTINVTSGLEISSNTTVVLKDNVTLNMGGDLTLSGDSSTWDCHSLTVDNGEDTHSVSIGSVLSAEWDHALTISRADSSYVVLESEDKAVTMNGGSITSKNVIITGTKGAPVTMDGVAINATNTSLEYCVVQDDSSITSTSDSGTLSLDNVTLVLDSENSPGSYQGSTYVIDSNLLDGTMTVDGDLTLDLSTYMDDILAGEYETLTMNVVFDNSVDLNNTEGEVAYDSVFNSLYEDVSLTASDNTIQITGTARQDNYFSDAALTANSTAGSELLWTSRYSLGTGTTLYNLYSAVADMVYDGNNAGASRALAAAAGSTVTSLGIAQRDALRDQMLWIRNRVTQMGANGFTTRPGADLPNVHLWIQGTGSYTDLDTSGDKSGYKLTTWGGTMGADVDINSHLTLGAAFTANYGDLEAKAADVADGDLDSYYLNLFGRYQSGKWSHLLILTGGWNDAKLTRTVNYGTGSYQGRGDTNGLGFGAMYELAYDIALNENKSVILQPLFNASVVTTTMDGYNETGAGNAGLRVEDQDLTTVALAAGARLSGLVGSKVFARRVMGEVRVNVSQDLGDRRGEANVGFLANPGFTRTVYGSNAGRTALQFGGGLNILTSSRSSIFVEANADIRERSSSVNGSVGFRYNF